MSHLSTQQRDAINLAVSCIVDAVKVAGPFGAPSGVVYAALMAHGMTLATYQSLLDALERTGQIVVKNNLITFPIGNPS